MINVRPEQPEDHEAVYTINASAFGRPAEAELVEALRTGPEPKISLVAEVDGSVVGHIFFSPVSFEIPSGERYTLLGLAPMAVLPEYQDQGVGSALVRRGLQACLEAGHPVVIVLGHPDYYPRFGFRPASTWGVRCAYDVPEEVFMLVELEPGALAGRWGVVRYPSVFDGV